MQTLDLKSHMHILCMCVVCAFIYVCRSLSSKGNHERGRRGLKGGEKQQWNKRIYKKAEVGKKGNQPEKNTEEGNGGGEQIEQIGKMCVWGCYKETPTLQANLKTENKNSSLYFQQKRTLTLTKRLLTVREHEGTLLGFVPYLCLRAGSMGVVTLKHSPQ